MIELKDLRKSYKTGDFIQKALDGVSLAFRDNEFVAVLGPSGSGKTTLLNVLGGLDHADEGDIVIDGVSTKDYASKDWDTYRNHHIGFIFQSYNLIPHQTVLSNVELALTLAGVGRTERKQRAIEALERVGLGEHIHKKPSQLSGGQMQRVAIARALVNDPNIVLADEPTGALDTETGIQVMNLLKEIANDRLVIMVTHNPELAEEYATRIVRLADGKVIDDSDPLPLDATAPLESTHASPEEGAAARAVAGAPVQPQGAAEPYRKTAPAGSAQKGKRASMSFLTALSLSFNNLMTKKGRTFMTAFAGSIGIIGIAAILALSNGVNNYIAKVEEDTLSSTPLTISQSSFDVTSIMTQAGDYTRGAENIDTSNPDAIPEATLMADVLRDVKTNDLKSLRAYFESPECTIKKYTNAIVYSYGIIPQIYKADTSDGIKQLNPGSLSNMTSGGTSASLSSMTSGNSFQRMLDDQKLLEEQYDLVAGKWPTNYDECILVLNQSGQISDYTLYSIGVLDPDELKDLLTKAFTSKEIEVPNTKVEFTKQDALNLSFKVVNQCDMYTPASSGDTWVDRTDDTDYMKQLIANGIDLKIVGIIQQNSTASATSLSEGIGYRNDLILHLIDQAANSPVVKAQEADPDVDIFTGKTFESLKDENANSVDMSKIFTVDATAIANAFKMDPTNIQQAISGSMQAASGSIDFTHVFDDMPLPEIPPEAAKSGGEKIVAALGELSSDVASGFVDYCSKNGVAITNPAAVTQAKIAYMQTPEYLALFKNATDGVGDGNQEIITATMSKYLDKIARYLPSKMQSVLQQYSMAIASNLGSSLGQAMSSSMSFDASVFASAINVNMDENEMASLFTSMAKASELTYDNNLKTLGYADIAVPRSISIYAKSFEDKNKVEDIIKAYNDDMKAKGQDEKVVSYSDIMGVLMSSVTDIINMISLVLIAFVAISLVVSSIMIGIITYISVLERKKEIGILRAMGASKLNIANVFNAETFIEGLISGILAIAVVYIASLIVNPIIYKGFNVPDIMILPISSALILIGVSVLLTFIAGLIPSSAASRRDPVEALRSE